MVARQFMTTAMAVLFGVSAASAQNFGPWSPAVSVDPGRSGINTTVNDGCPIEAPDGNTLFFASNRAGDLDIWVASRHSDDGPWGEPERLPSPVNRVGSGEFCPTPLRVVRRVGFLVDFFVAGELFLGLRLRSVDGFGLFLGSALAALARDALEGGRAILQAFFDGNLVPLAQREHPRLHADQRIVLVTLLRERRKARPHGDFRALAHVAQQVFLDRYERGTP
jgi:hypothetical protein